MGTQINIAFDRGGLVERNRQQTTANRQNKVEQDSRSKTADKAKVQRDQKLEEENKNTFGSKRPSGTLVSAYKDRPAASRFFSDILLGPYAGSFTYNGSIYFLVDDFWRKKRALPSSGQGPSDGLFAVATDYAVDYPNPLSSTTTFEAGAGPLGTNAVQMEAYTPWGGGYGVAVTGCRVTSGAPPGPGVLNPGETYDSVEIYDPLLEALGYDPTYTQYGWPDCELEIVQVYAPGYEADCLLELEGYFSSANEEDRRTLLDPSRSTWEILLKAITPCPIRIAINIGPLEINIDPVQAQSEIIRPYNAAGLYAPQSYPIEISSGSLSSWTHLAVVTDSQEFRFYAGGQLLKTIPNPARIRVDSSSIHFWQTFYEASHPTPAFYGPDVTSYLYVHGLRISRKTRYAGASFTPPVVIQ